MAYKKGEIGLHSGTVKLVAHHPKWAKYFSEEKQLLFKMLGKKVLDIRHIGSTSIPGIPAKPILDILAAVKMLADVETFTQDLNKIGYEEKGAGGVPGRRYFVKGTEAKRTHHLNFCEMNSFFWRNHLAFRDYLERHPEIARKYSVLKRELADRFPNDRGAYTAGKEEFVRSILDRAKNTTRTSSDKESTIPIRTV
jgi:GrpB-like predicted nucleotidyltransferase (UPF0157 family)